MVSRTQGELLNAALEAKDLGATTDQILATIARMITRPTAASEEFEGYLSGVRDVAILYYDGLPEGQKPKGGCVPHLCATARLNALMGDDQIKVIRLVVTKYGIPDGPISMPVLLDRLSDNLLNDLRSAAALKVEHGDCLESVYALIQQALIKLLLIQTVEPNLVEKSITHALETGKPIAEAIEFAEGRV